ncbi:poly-gamma-glutamate hydrolase family protein [Streptomyces sp. NPDC012765]|uniref:poly-gamma-glutamate hydrolase family protein n=1 Tax=Streptomyces sp. NPDC012765 TaxID=3155249 RepID=UPI0033C9BDCD
MTLPDLIWGALLLAGLTYEGYAIANRVDGGTLSERLRAWLHTPTRNICNQNTRQKGVQLELSTAQRAALFVGGDFSRANRQNRTPAFHAYVVAVQSALAQALVTTDAP